MQVHASKWEICARVCIPGKLWGFIAPRVCFKRQTQMKFNSDPAVSAEFLFVNILSQCGISFNMVVPHRLPSWDENNSYWAVLRVRKALRTVCNHTHTHPSCTRLCRYFYIPVHWGKRRVDQVDDCRLYVCWLCVFFYLNCTHGMQQPLPGDGQVVLARFTDSL